MDLQLIKRLLVKHFETVFVLTVLFVVGFVHYFVIYKLAFLNIYFLPVILAAYYLDLRKALLGAFACVLMVALYAHFSPGAFGAGINPVDRFLNVLTWGCILLLTGVVVADLHSKLQAEIAQTKHLNDELIANKNQLEAAGKELREYASNLERMVSERTESLEKSKLSIEELKKKIEDALYSTMDSSVVKMIIEKRLHSEKRRISVLFSDLKGFTRYSEERRPEVVITDLNRFLKEMEDVLLNYHAHLDKYMGDGLMVEFGAPIDFERHPLLAVAAGLKMQERLAKARFPWPMRVGIATGESIIGLIGDARRTYTAIGDTVNIASRIQELCAPGHVTIDQATFDEVGRFFNCTRRVAMPYFDYIEPKMVLELQELIDHLHENPEDAKAVKKVAWMFVDHNDAVNANVYLKRAMELDPKDDQVKLAYAENSVHLGKLEKISIRGREKRLHLYDVIGLKNVLLNRDKIPQSLFDKYAIRVEQTAAYPENLILPVECLDGSVGHSKVVGVLSYALADSMDLPDREKKDILIAGYLADIGKSIIPHHLLNHHGSLSKAEFAEVVKHSRESVRVLKSMGFVETDVFEIIGAHHESPNGDGYPEGLRDERIPLGAKIIAVTDAYDSLTSWRPYRDHWEAKAAYVEMQRQAKQGHFDPNILTRLGALLEIA